MSTTTTTTEISSNSNSSCRLLVCLNTLPFHDQRVFRSLLGHIELVRLSACCHSLRSSIRNDTVLWQALYHRDFLSGVYYAKEMEFVLWCARTDANNPCTSDKRADLLENVDWYNTYRRRVSTENNWRYGRYNIARIDIVTNGDGVRYRKDVNDNCIFFTQENGYDGPSGHSYTLEYSSHSHLRTSNNIVHNSTLFTSPNVLSLDSGNAVQPKYVTGDHYIAVAPREIESDNNINVRILSRKHGGVFTTFDVPARYKVKIIEGKWVLLVRESKEKCDGSPRYIFSIMVFDIDNSIMCPGSIDGTWNARCFYKTTNNTAIVYTARLVKDDDTDRIEWALYQFSSNNPVVQLRSGWFQLPEKVKDASLFAHNSYDSHMIIELRGLTDYKPYIVHSVASSGQSHTPRNCYAVFDLHMPTPLLRAGCRYSMIDYKQPTVWTDLSYNDDQVLQIPETVSIRHIIGDLYVFNGKRHKHIKNRWLVDITTKEIIRRLEAPNQKWKLKIEAMVGTIYSLFDNRMQLIQEYGEL